MIDNEFDAMRVAVVIEELELMLIEDERELKTKGLVELLVVSEGSLVETELAVCYVRKSARGGRKGQYIVFALLQQQQAWVVQLLVQISKYNVNIDLLIF
jgi:hypothetical protein